MLGCQTCAFSRLAFVFCLWLTAPCPGVRHLHTAMSLNPNPVVYEVPQKRRRRVDLGACDASGRDVVDAAEVFEHIRHIADPEHPLSLEQLHVVREEHITVRDDSNHVSVLFTPTIPHW